MIDTYAIATGLLWGFAIAEWQGNTDISRFERWLFPFLFALTWPLFLFDFLGRALVRRYRA